jgi:hypothetical protein
MATFNISNGSLTGTGSDGYSFTWTPPFNSQTQIDAYIQALQGASGITSSGIFNLQNLSPGAVVSSVRPGNQLPAVQVYNIANPPTFAVVYTNASGNSQFSYKNDPTNLIQLVQGGSQIGGTTTTSAPGGSQYTISQSSGTVNQGSSLVSFVCSCLSCISSIAFLVGCLAIILALFKQS